MKELNFNDTQTRTFCDELTLEKLREDYLDMMAEMQTDDDLADMDDDSNE